MAAESNKCYLGDCRDIMRKLAILNEICPGPKIQTCITSPPYWGLRDYGVDGQLGLEPTIDEYITNMVEVFRCVWDLLADDGTLWVNMGDGYTSGGRSTWRSGVSDNKGHQCLDNAGHRPETPQGLKPKDLIGQPWRLAFALQADGWYLRQDIIWHKPNPMPESVKDRCTKSHEYIFLLSKNKKYYFDSEAIKEPAKYFGKDARSGKGNIRYEGKRTLGDPAKNGQQSFVTINSTRNKRSVWSVNTAAFKGAHFATFPPKLIEPCILAGSREGDIIIDPFFGSGTTGQVCKSLNRQWIGCELNEEYLALQEERINGR